MKLQNNNRGFLKGAFIFNNNFNISQEIMIKEMICILLLFPVTQQYPLEKKEIGLSESRLQYASPFRRNFIASTTPCHLTKAHPLRRKSRNVFKLPNDVLDGREGNIHRSEHSAKSKLNKQVSSNGIYKSRNVFKLPNNDRKTKGPNVSKTKEPNSLTTKGPNVWKTKGPNVRKTRGPNVFTTKEPNVWKTRGPNVLTTKGPNVLTTKGPTAQPTETSTHDNIKTTSSTSSNVSKTRGPIVQPNKNVSKLSQTTDETNNIGTVVGPSVACIVLSIVVIIAIAYKYKSICTRGQRQYVHAENPNQVNDIERQLINGHKKPIGIDNENSSN